MNVSGKVHLRIRRAAMVEGMCVRKASPNVRPAPGHSAQDSCLLAPVGMLLAQRTAASRIRTVNRGDRPDSG